MATATPTLTKLDRKSGLGPQQARAVTGGVLQEPAAALCEGGIEGGKVMSEIDSEDQFGRPEFSRVMGWITPLLATAIGG